MITTIVVAMAMNNVIGNNNQLPWSLPADLKHFKTITMGKPLLMGRLTYESIGRALPGRLNMVLSRKPEVKIADCEVVTNIEAAYDLATKLGAEELIIMGGANLYAQMLPKADKLQLTLVDADIDGDAYFPEIDFSIWQEVARREHPADDKNQYPYTFLTLIRKN